MKSKKTFSRFVSTLVICSVLVLPNSPVVHAEMVTTENFLAEKNQTTPRDRVMSLLQRDEVLQKLKEFGVNPYEAKQRLASLSEAEINKLSTEIDQLPAGADTAGAILGTALVVFLVLLITDVLCLTKVFRFTRCAG